MAGPFSITQQADEKQVRSIYEKILLTGNLPGELSGNSLQARLLALGVAAYALTQSQKTGASLPKMQPDSFSYASLYNAKDLEAQQVLLAISSKFADAIMESRLLSPYSGFDQAMTSYLERHPAVTLALVNGVQKTPEQFRKDCQPFGPRQELGESETGITGFVSPDEQAEARIRKAKKFFVDSAAAMIPFLPELRERREKLSEALYSPTADNIIAAAGARQEMPGQLVMAGVLNLALLPVPWAKIVKGEVTALSLLKLAKLPENRELAEIIVAGARKLEAPNEIAAAVESIAKKDVDAFMKLPSKKKQEVFSKIASQAERAVAAPTVAKTIVKPAKLLEQATKDGAKAVLTPEFKDLSAKYPDLFQVLTDAKNFPPMPRGSEEMPATNMLCRGKNFDLRITPLPERANQAGLTKGVWRADIVDNGQVVKSFLVDRKESLMYEGVKGESRIKALNSLRSICPPDIEVVTPFLGWTNADGSFAVTEFHDLPRLYDSYGLESGHDKLLSQLRKLGSNAKDLGITNIRGATTYYDSERGKLIVFEAMYGSFYDDAGKIVMLKRDINYGIERAMGSKYLSQELLAKSQQTKNYFFPENADALMDLARSSKEGLSVAQEAAKQKAPIFSKEQLKELGELAR
jgi:hypothetical protein